MFSQNLPLLSFITDSLLGLLFHHWEQLLCKSQAWASGLWLQHNQIWHQVSHRQYSSTQIVSESWGFFCFHCHHWPYDHWLEYTPEAAIISTRPPRNGKELVFLLKKVLAHKTTMAFTTAISRNTTTTPQPSSSLPSLTKSMSPWSLFRWVQHLLFLLKRTPHKLWYRLLPSPQHHRLWIHDGWVRRGWQCHHIHGPRCHHRPLPYRSHMGQV